MDVTFWLKDKIPNHPSIERVYMQKKKKKKKKKKNLIKRIENK